MLGVVGIHIGTFVLDSSTPRLDIFLLLQIFTRFAVPAFFFISGYGLFCNGALHKPFHYVASVRHHLRTVGVPYLVWSLFYIALWQREDMIRPDGSFSLSVLLVKLLLGEGCYHIYFLVILLGFYFTLPFWRWLVRMTDRGTKAGTGLCLAVLAALQLVLYHWNAVYWSYPAWTAHYKVFTGLCSSWAGSAPCTRTLCATGCGRTCGAPWLCCWCPAASTCTAFSVIWTGAWNWPPFRNT